MRTINRTAVLEIIRTQSPVSRGHIASELGLSLPSVVRIVDGLRAENLVRQTGKSEFSGGRKRPLLEINASENLAIGVDLGGTKAYGAVCDLSGEILRELSVDNHGTKGDGSYKIVRELIETLIGTDFDVNRVVRGIGIGVPGVTEPRRGVVQWAPSLEWRDFPLAERIERDFGLSVIVDNDVNSAVLGEMWFGHGKNVSNLVLVTLGTGIGAGLVLDGALYRGPHLFAGEIGYIPWSRGCLDREYSGFGPLEQVAAGTGIAEIARSALRGSLDQESLDKLTAQDVFEACGRNEEWASRIVEEASDYLAMALLSVCSVADPEVIVIGGGISRSAGLFIDRVRSRMKGRIPYMPEIEISNLRERGTVLGAMINLFYLNTDYCVVRSLS
jgi:glucokinase-like ROK family protein